jgi:sugar phosphate isomerase/epimerase
MTPCLVVRQLEPARSPSSWAQVCRSPSGAPGFIALRDALLNAALGEDVSRQITGDIGWHITPEQVFERLDDGRPEQRTEIVRYLQRVLDVAVEPNLNHVVLAALLHAGASVWTTNFDRLIERAGERMGIPVEVVTR